MKIIEFKLKGRGQFGSVYLVKHKDQSEMFALKCVSKQQIIEQNLEKYLKVTVFH
jgi:cGMP-dependent protein kinase